MKLFSALLGNSSAISAEELQKEFEHLLIEGEVMELAFKLIRDIFIFTNKRLLFIDKQGITGKKMEYYSLPYKSITRFSIETAGTLDLDAELKIWIGSSHEPNIVQKFTKAVNVYDVQKYLAMKVL